jgi:hypothetical protein
MKGRECDSMDFKGEILKKGEINNHLVLLQCCLNVYALHTVLLERL